MRGWLGSLLFCVLIGNGCVEMDGLSEEAASTKSQHAPLAESSQNRLLRAKADLRSHQPTERARVEYEEALQDLLGPGLDFDFAAQSGLRAELMPEQVNGWRDLHDSGRGHTSVIWDRRRKSPALIQGLNVGLDGTSDQEAFARLQSRGFEPFSPLFRITPDDYLAQFVVDRPEADQAERRGTTFFLKRRFKGFEVQGDFLAVTLQRDESSGTFHVVQVDASWGRDVPEVVLDISVDEATATSLLKDEGDFPVDSRLQAPAQQIIVYAASGKPTLALRLFWGTPDDPWLVYLDSETGGIIRRHHLVVDDHAGTIKVRSGRPGDGNQKFELGLPHAFIFDGQEQESIWCDGQTTTVGDRDLRKGPTGYHGDFAGLTSGLQNPNWTVDVRGKYAHDYTHCLQLRDDAVRNLNIGFDPATSTSVIPLYPLQSDSRMRRRLEHYYHVTFANIFFKNSAYGIPIYEYTPTTNFPPLLWVCSMISTDCENNPESPVACCSGSMIGAPNGGQYVSYPNEFIGYQPTIKLSYNYEVNGLVANSAVERRCRGVSYHELGHTLRIRTGSDIFDSDTGYMSYEEGRAEFAKATVGRFEDIRPEYLPDRIYPDDWNDFSVYQSASVFSALFLDYHLRTGPGVAAKDIHLSTYLSSVDDYTQLVGDCSDDGPNGNDDGQTTVADCPSNSHYAKMLASNSGTWLTKYQNRFEISKVFHDHVRDPIRSTQEEEEFPWADQVNNHYTRAPFLTGCEMATSSTVSEGGEPGSGPLALDYDGDYDSFLFYGRAGEQYRLETVNVGPYVDTVLEVLGEGSETIIGSNDDCGYYVTGSVSTCSTGCEGGDQLLRSCLLFTPAYNGMYALRVSPYSAYSTGPGKTYAIRTSILSDDYSDTMNGARALAPSTSATSGELNGAGDKDWFKVSSNKTQTMTFRGCSASVPITAKVYSPTAQFLGTWTFPDCSSNVATTSVGVGNYYIEVSSSGSSGSYEFFASLEGDQSSSPTDAFPLANWLPDGFTYGAQFETAADEDWFQFTVDQGKFIAIHTFGLSSGVDTYLELYAPTGKTFHSTHVGLPGYALADTSGAGIGHWMQADDDGGFDSLASRIQFVSPVSGTYFLRVINKGTSAGSYHLLFYPLLFGGACCYPEFP